MISTFNGITHMKKRFGNSFKSFLFIVFALIATQQMVIAQNATWIWYPGDFEVWLSNKMQNRRTERGSFFPPFWKLDNHFVCVDFSKTVTLNEPETIEIYTEGDYNVKVNSKLVSPYSNLIQLPAGTHKINVKVFCQDRVPAVFVKGKTILSNDTWKVTYEDKEWIDETGKTSDLSATVYLQAAAWNFDSPATPPSKFKLTTRPITAVSVKKESKFTLVDFGKETFGFIKLHGLKGKGKLSLFYGESEGEAMATETCETLDEVKVQLNSKTDSVLVLSKAFRYVQVQQEAGVELDSISMLYEYLPLEQKGGFRCSDPLINRIYDVSVYTMELNSREFFIDGIKRDRWIWSGDAYQSYLMNYYLYNDDASVKRTLYALRGKDPVTSHINTIMDYTFYWFIGVYDYYLFSGDKNFITQIYPRMKSMMDYCLKRRNKDGLMEGLTGDWVFIDWAEKLSKQGEVSFEQMLLCRSLETMALCANMTGDNEMKNYYSKEAATLKEKLFSIYWNESKGAMVHSRVNGQQTDNVTRYANMFGVFFDYFNPNQRAGVLKNVLLNDKVQKITTPYMRFYELEALCALGEQNYVLKEMRNYWGGMLNLGATSFWEEYNPTKSGAEHYAMYGRPFGKSLCHAWGASPIYLLGKYYLGIKPITAGFDTYLVEPVLGDLAWMEGKVPTPGGNINLRVDKKLITINADKGVGTLKFKSKSKPVCKTANIISNGSNSYEITIPAGQQLVVKYQAL